MGLGFGLVVKSVAVYHIHAQTRTRARARAHTQIRTVESLLSNRAMVWLFSVLGVGVVALRSNLAIKLAEFEVSLRRACARVFVCVCAARTRG